MNIKNDVNTSPNIPVKTSRENPIKLRVKS